MEVISKIIPANVQDCHPYYLLNIHDYTVTDLT